MTSLERPRRKRQSGVLQMNGLLDVLAVPRVGAFEPLRKHINLCVRRRRGSWWYRNQHQLDVLLYDIHAAYQRAIRRAHPDKGGKHEDAVEVNKAWSKVKKLFAQRGITLN